MVGRHPYGYKRWVVKKTEAQRIPASGFWNARITA